MKLVVCPTPIGNLEDVTLRVLAALRDADVVACEDTRHTRGLLKRHGIRRRWSPTTSTTSARGRESWSSGCAAATVVALVSATRACRSSTTRATTSSRPRSRRGSTVEVLPGPSRHDHGARRERAAQRRVALRGLPPAQGRRVAGGVHRARDRRGVRVAPPRRRQPQAPRRARPRAPRRRLPRADEAARGDRPRHGAGARGEVRGDRPAGRDRPGGGRRPQAEGLDPKAVEAVRLLVDAGARSKTAAKVVSELTGAPSNELYRAC